MKRTTILFLGFAMAAGCGSSSTTDAGTGTDVPTTTDTGTQTDAATGTDVVTATDTPQATDTPAATDAPSGSNGTVMGLAANYSDGTGISGVTVKTCAASDMTCASPSATATTDAQGHFTITYPLTGTTFAGYFQFTGGGANAVTPTRLFTALPAAPGSVTFSLVPQATFTGLSGLFGATFDATHGAVTFAVSNSSGGIAGATVAASPTAGNEFYIMGAVPSESATATDVSGEGGFFNTAPGNYTFTASGGDAGTLGTVTASVVGNFVTAFSL